MKARKPVGNQTANDMGRDDIVDAPESPDRDIRGVGLSRTSRRKRLSVVAVCVMACAMLSALLVGCSQTPQQDAKLAIIHTNDVHGYINA